MQSLWFLCRQVGAGHHIPRFPERRPLSLRTLSGGNVNNSHICHGPNYSDFWNHLNGLLNFSINTSMVCFPFVNRQMEQINKQQTMLIVWEEHSVFTKPNPTCFLAANHSDCGNFLSRTDFRGLCGSYVYSFSFYTWAIRDWIGFL